MGRVAPRRLIQILGTNGSGKSTTLAEWTGEGTQVYYGTHGPYTSCPESQTVLVGDYHTGRLKTPGVDRLSPKAKILAALDEALAGWPTYDVAWEGIIIMTRQYHAEYLRRGLRPFYVVLTTPLEGCFTWLESRSGQPRSALKRNGAIVSARYKSVSALAQWLEQQPHATVLYHNPQEGRVWPKAWVRMGSAG